MRQLPAACHEHARAHVVHACTHTHVCPENDWIGTHQHTPEGVFQGHAQEPFVAGTASDEWWGTLCNFVMHLYIDQALEMLAQVRLCVTCD